MRTPVFIEFCIGLAGFSIGVSMIDSDSIIPIVITVVSVAWLMLLANRNWGK